MSTAPLKVAVTGAAGQIGYSLLFRLASGVPAGRRPPDRAAAAGDRAGPPGPRGRGHGARRLRVPDARRRRDRRRPDEDLRRRQPRPAGRRPPARPGHGAQRPARGERRDLHRAGQGAQPGRRRRRPHRGDRQPGQHQRAHRDVQRTRHPARAVLGADPARPQPGDLAARRQDRRGGHRHQEDDDLGQPLGHPVPRPVPRRGRWPQRRRGRRRPGLAGEHLHPDRRQARRRDHRRARVLLGRLRRVGHHRRRPRLAVRLRRGRLGVDGGRLRRLLRRARGPDLVVPGHHLRRRLEHRPGSRDRRLLPRPHRRDRRGARPRRRTPSPSSA